MTAKFLQVSLLLLLGSCQVQGQDRPNLPPSKPVFRVEQRPEATLYSLTIPAALAPQVDVAVTDGVATLPQFAQRTGAIALINGGYFDPSNDLSTSFVRRQGQILADPRRNPRLTDNPALQPYLTQIFDRSELRQYRCGDTIRFAIAQRTAPLPQGCREGWALGGGPQLLPNQSETIEAFLGPDRDPIGVSRPNARTAVGLTAKGDLIWLLVAQRSDSSAVGLSLGQTATVLQQMGAIAALNLDGGTSSALLWQSKLYLGKITEAGQPSSRSVKSVLWLRPIAQ
jgi:hypothetical protein